MSIVNLPQWISIEPKKVLLSVVAATETCARRVGNGNLRHIRTFNGKYPE